MSMHRTSFIVCTVLATFLLPSSAFAVKTVGDLKKVENQVQDLVSKVLQCTVCVRSERGQGSGSGVTVSEDGLVFTAAHVTMAAGEDLVVIFPDGREVKAKSLGANRARDAGMVQITEDGPFPYVEIGESKDLKKNDWCISLGHAGGFQNDRSPPVRLGRILANERFVVTDCAIIAGDSGGPLFDLEGRLIGIHSNIGESLSQNQHVPVDVFHDDWDRMKKGDTWGRLGGQRTNPRQPVMGVQLSPAQNDDGVVVGGITPNSPADNAGLEANDVIAKINGKKVARAEDIVRIVARNRPGDTLKLKVKRGDEMLDFDVRLIRAGELARRNQPRRRPPTEDDSSDKDEKSAKSDSETESESEKKDTDKAQAENNEEGRSIEELLREARRSRGRLELSQEERQRLQKFMRERMGGFGGRLGIRPPANDGPDKWFIQVMKAYEPVVAIANDSTYRVLVEGKQVALATAVSPDTLLTKASEIADKEFEIEVGDGDQADGRVLEVFSRYDLALVQVEGAKLKPAELLKKEKELPLGTFLASVGKAKDPVAIGLISVKTRELAAGKGFLGVMLDASEGEIVIRDVSQRSPAKRAGLKVNDVILKLNNKKYPKLLDLINAVGSHQPDDKVELLVRRGDEEVTVDAKLGKRPTNPRSRIEMMNRMGSELSDMRSGFPKALQHDCPIPPNACGGPLVNLDGEVVGINIARAGRIKSYALPAYVIDELLAKGKKQETVAP